MKHRPIDFVTRDEADRARRALDAYRRHYTGRHYETFARRSPPEAFAATDIVAVEMLAVRVPAHTSIWLLHDGADEVRSLLRSVPPDLPIWSADVDLSPTGGLWRLWEAIRTRGGLGGRVVRSKLLAAKRPHAVPIYDQHVAAALGAPRDGYWAYWYDELSGTGGEELRTAALAVAAAASASDLSVPRILDIVIWMRQHGWKDMPELLADFADPI